MILQQYELGQGITRMKTWLPLDKRVRVGSVLTLEKEDGRWRVLQAFEARIELSSINRGWNNNI